MSTRLVIAGGGHASLPILKMGHHWKKLGISITLVSDQMYLIYSGALPQFAGGFFTFDEISINLKDLCERYGVEFCQGRVKAVNQNLSLVETSSGDKFLYDLLLINVGARTNEDHPESSVFPVKPLSKLLPLFEELKAGTVQKLLIAGGGAAGTELALNLSHPASSVKSAITITEHGNRLLSAFPKRLSDKVTRILGKRGVSVLLNNSFEQVTFSDFDAVIMATGNRPESLSIDHTFRTGQNQRLLTLPTLQLPGLPNIFAAGDTADVDGKNYSQIGVHAVKQGPLLRSNINAFFEGRPLKPYKPYPVNPLILSNGPDHAFFTAKSFVSGGRPEAILKYAIDMKWLEKYTMPPERRRSFYQLMRDGEKRSRTH